MIKNFESTKKQLSELAEIINSFKSEAVQLRIIDLFLGNSPEEELQSEDPLKNNVQSAQKSKHRKKKTSAIKAESASDTHKKTAPAGTGAAAILNQMVTTDFFNKPKTIKNIIAHCSTNLARNFKANAFSGKLGRMVRNGELTRKKNTDNQYEYTKA